MHFRWTPFFLIVCTGPVRADAGTLRASERVGSYQVTVFTAPAPVRAGPVDVSVLVQNEKGTPIAREVSLSLWPRGRPEEKLRQTGTALAATNKLFRAAVFDLPEAGWWDGEVEIAGLAEPLRIPFALEAAGPLPAWRSLAPWVAWPLIVIALFALHQVLVRRHRQRSFRAPRSAFRVQS